MPYPASGSRASSIGSLYGIGTYGYVWSSSPGSATNVNVSNLYFHGSLLSPESGYNRADGFPVRCVQE